MNCTVWGYGISLGLGSAVDQGLEEYLQHCSLCVGIPGYEERRDRQRYGRGTIDEQACMNRDMEAAYALRSRRCLKRTALLQKSEHV